MNIHVSREGRSYGPYTLEQIHEHLGSRRLVETDWAWHQGLESWVPLGEIDGVELPAAPPPPPPPKVEASSPAEVALPASEVGTTPGATASGDPIDASGTGGEDPLSLGRAFAFPFQRPDWVRSMWWVVAICFIPFANVFLLHGWRVEFTRRLGQSHPQPMPEPKDLGRFGADGVILWLMSFLYWFPALVLFTLFGMDNLAKTLFLARWAFEKLMGSELTMTLESILSAFGWAGLAEAVITSLYLVLMYPVYRAGMIRFALTNRVSSFFRLGANIRLSMVHLRDFMVVFFFDLGMFKIGLGLVSVALTLTGIGLVLIPAIVVPVYYSSTGYLYGALAERLRPEITG